MEAEVIPTNTRHFRLPECQKKEVDRQVNQLLEDGIMAKNYTPWNCHTLVALKKVDPDGKTKWPLVVDFPN